MHLWFSAILLTLALSSAGFSHDVDYRQCILRCQAVETLCKSDCTQNDHYIDAECFDQCEATGEACVFATCGTLAAQSKKKSR